jgi:hypothetical protein
LSVGATEDQRWVLETHRKRAAECVLAHAAKAIEIEEIEARLATLAQAPANGTQRR